MRHGRAEDSNPGGDAARTLTPAGGRAVEGIGARFAQERHPLSSIVTSPFVRTVQTAEAFLKGARLELSPASESRLASGTRAESMLEVVQESALPTLLIGHMPDVSALVSLVCSGAQSTRVVFEPGTIACVRFLGSPRVGNAALTWMRQPNQW
ncbi:MAG: histidine phosphatase family protein [Myxococcota bacterium]